MWGYKEEQNDADSMPKPLAQVAAVLRMRNLSLNAHNIDGEVVKVW
jgi:hypothetical protein